MALGADDYITKPFTERDILDAIAARNKRHGGSWWREKIEQLAERQRRESNAQWSHELLTPLNAVIGGLDLLEMDAETISRDELKEMLALIRNGAERQERLARKLICYFGLEQRLHAPPLGPARAMPGGPVQSMTVMFARTGGKIPTAKSPSRPKRAKFRSIFQEFARVRDRRKLVGNGLEILPFRRRSDGDRDQSPRPLSDRNRRTKARD